MTIGHLYTDHRSFKFTIGLGETLQDKLSLSGKPSTQGEIYKNNVSMLTCTEAQALQASSPMMPKFVVID